MAILAQSMVSHVFQHTRPTTTGEVNFFSRRVHQSQASSIISADESRSHGRGRSFQQTSPPISGEVAYFSRRVHQSQAKSVISADESTNHRRSRLFQQEGLPFVRLLEFTVLFLKEINLCVVQADSHSFSSTFLLAETINCCQEVLYVRRVRVHVRGWEFVCAGESSCAWVTVHVRGWEFVCAGESSCALVTVHVCVYIRINVHVCERAKVSTCAYEIYYSQKYLCWYIKILFYRNKTVSTYDRHIFVLN